MRYHSADRPQDRNAPSAQSPIGFFEAPKPPTGASYAVRPRRIRNEARPQKISSEYSIVSFSDTEYEKSVVKSAHRALQVLEFFAEFRHPATARQIAVNLDFPQSSTSMLLRSLASLGYLRYCEQTRLYSPSLRLSLIVGWQPELTGIAADILDLMRQLNVETGECVTLAEQYRHHVRYIYVLQSTDPQKVHYVPHGTLRPIGTTACGQMLLTLKSEREQRAIVHGARSEAESIDYGMSLEEVIAAVKRWSSLGYAYTSRMVSGFRSYQLATLLPQRDDSPPMSIGITSYGDRFVERQPEILDRLLSLVANLSKD